MAAKNLTPTFARNVKVDTRTDYSDAKVPGLQLRVTPNGVKTFTLMYRPKGIPKQQRLTLGRYPSLSLAEARERALDVLKIASRGIDVRAEAKAKFQRMAVSDLGEKFIELHAKPNKRTWARDKAYLEKDVYPTIGDMPIEDVHRRDINRILDRIEQRGARIQANRTFEVVRKMFNWAIERGYLDASPCVGVKPRAQEQTRDRVLSGVEVVTFWTRLGESRMDPGTQMALKLCLVTGQRSGEVAGMRVSEIDFDKRSWTIPGGRTKNGQLHEVPLSDLAVKLIREATKLGQSQTFVFPSPKKGQCITSHAIAVAIRRSAGILQLEDFRAHDLRRTVATELAALGVTDSVTGRILNHATETKSTITGRVYNRHSFQKEKREAMDMWAARLIALVDGVNVVVPLHRAG